MFTKSLIALLCLQLILLPVQSRAESVDRVKSDVSDLLEKSGWDLSDAEGNRVTPRELLESPLPEFHATDKASDLRLRIVRKGLRISLVVSDAENGNVLSRRTISIDPTKGPAEDAALLYEQTVQSITNDVIKKRKITTSSLLQKVYRVFAGTVGIPTAHAGDNLELHQMLRTIVPVVLSAAILAFVISLPQSNWLGSGKKLPASKIGIATSLLTLVAAIIANIKNEEEISRIRTEQALLKDVKQRLEELKRQEAGRRRGGH